MQPPAMLDTSALQLLGLRRRQISCRPGTSLGVGRGDKHLAPNQVCTGGGISVIHTIPRFDVRNVISDKNNEK